MLFNRLIPILLLSKGGLYKTQRYKNPSYVGDPINAVKIFNEKKVDEISIIDIDATLNNYRPNLSILEDIVSESFMPLSYGGGIKDLGLAKEIFALGIEKIVMNSLIRSNPLEVKKMTNFFGSQSVVASIDIKKDFFGSYHIWDYSSRRSISNSIPDEINRVADLGVGEILLSYVDKEGLMKGPDKIIEKHLTKDLKIPIIYNGGISSINDCKEIFSLGVDAVAAGAFFVYKGPHRAVLISYPEDQGIRIKP